MKDFCIDCFFNVGYCNCLVIPGGMGLNDKVASDFLKNEDEKCNYYKKGRFNKKEQQKINLNNS